MGHEGLHYGDALVKRSPLRKRNPKRRARLFAEDFHSKDFVEWIHGWACANCGITGYSEAAHTRSRGAGGKASDIIPLCGNHHGIEGCHSKYDRHAEEIAEYRDCLRRQAKNYWTDFQATQRSEDDAA